MLPCKDSSPAAGDDLDPSDAYECRHRRRVGLATSCQDSARYRVPCALDQRPFVPRQRNNFLDCDPASICLPVSMDNPCAAIPIKKIHTVSKNVCLKYQIN